MEDKAIDSLAVYIIKLHAALIKRGMPDGLAVHVVSIVAFHQFNGTRNDDLIRWERLLAILKETDKEIDNGS